MLLLAENCLQYQKWSTLGRGVFCANKARISAAKAVLLQAKAAAMRMEPHAEISLFVSAKPFSK